MTARNVFVVLTFTLGCRRRDEAIATRSPSQGEPAPSTVAGSCNSAVVGTYSSLKTSAVTGDFGGFEVDLRCADGVYSAGVTVAEGAPEPAVDALAQVHDTVVHIIVPANSRLSGMESFDGVVSGGHLIGRFANDVSVDLPRRQ